MNGMSNIHLWILFAGITGAVMPVALREGLGARRAATQLFGGVMTAVFVAPAIITYFLPLAGSQIQAAVSFLIGYFGLAIVGVLQRLLDHRGEDLANRLIERLTGGSGDKS